MPGVVGLNERIKPLLKDALSMVTLWLTVVYKRESTRRKSMNINFVYALNIFM